MGVIKCSQCGRIVPDTLEACPKCGSPIVVAAPNEASISADATKTPQQTPAEEVKPKHSSTKRMVVRIISTLFAVALITGGAFIILNGSDTDTDTEAHGYAPWGDLSAYYNLDAIVEEEDFSHFNTYELTHDRLALTREHVAEGEYSAVVLGTGVWVRSYPQLKNRTKRCQVQTGDNLLVTRSAGYSDGSYWSYASVLTGRRAGKEGYISNDYIIEQDKFDVLQRYIFSGGSNMNVVTPAKYLNAIATVLVKLNVHKRYPNLQVSILDTAVMGQNMIVTYKVHDLNVVKNSTLLVFVQFFGNNNDYIVLGVVPGTSVNHIAQNVNGSYDIYYVKQNIIQ